MQFTPTPEQEAIVSALKTTDKSIMVTAYAGCAKTTTLEMLAQGFRDQPALALAFNVKIKKELEKRFPSNFEVKTLNGLGHSAWGKAIAKRCEVDENKRRKIINGVLDTFNVKLTPDQWIALRDLVDEAFSAGLVPSVFPYKGLVPDTAETWAYLASDNFLEVNETILKIAREIMIESNKKAFAGLIDYDDQIYCSALLGGVFPRFPMTFVDEAQDLSLLNHIQVAKSSAGRLVIVGDPKQAIYGFRGADSQSMGKLRKLRSDWIELPLATTFRCPQVIVQRQQKHAAGFRAAPSNAQGTVVNWTMNDTWSLPEGRPLAILCRNNAPIIGLAFRLIRRGQACVMLGRDIGKGLVRLAKKISSDDKEPIAQTIVAISEWIAYETDLAHSRDQPEKVAGIVDRGESLLAVAEFARPATAGQLRSAIADLFANTSGSITLATGHRSKGLEWDHVIHLDPWRVPSKYAVAMADKGQGSQLEQENNLLYVIETRTKKTLYLANSKDFEAA
jgi:DNA helicase II / ATP-dependent DNA helicase PcrA